MGVRVTQDLLIVRAGKLVVDGIDPGFQLQVDGSIISNHAALDELPAGLKVDGDLSITGASIHRIPSGIHVTGRVELATCRALRTICDDLQVDGQLSIKGCDSLEPLPDLKHVQTILHDRYSFWTAKKSIIIHGSLVDTDERRSWLGHSFNDLFGVPLYEQMSLCNSPILIIRETLSARGQSLEFTIGD